MHDTVAGIIERLRSTLSEDELLALKHSTALAALTDSERDVLGRGHIRFSVDRPVTVWIVRDASFGKKRPFWLRERGFEAAGIDMEHHGRPFDVWRRDFDAGRVGLGVNSIAGGKNHYYVLVSSDTGTPVITDLYPGRLRVGTYEEGALPFVDVPAAVSDVPAALDGHALVRTVWSSRNDAKLLKRFVRTDYPAAGAPDQVVLTWSGNPQTTQTIQWRTSDASNDGEVVYRKKNTWRFVSWLAKRRLQAQIEILSTPDVTNDPVNRRYTATLYDLKPGTTYEYTVGSGETAATGEFTTAPADPEPFSFVYMGDAQNGLDEWGVLVNGAFSRRPDAAFYIMAGDLVDRGAARDDWDSFFHNAQNVYDRRQLVPAIGNHEVQGGSAELYLRLFDLPRNGPADIEAERAYSFRYSNALFVILDTTIDPEPQAAWLDEQLAAEDVTWRFVVFHHPLYASRAGRDNPHLRAAWGPLIDRHKVDMVLQGHDHAYLRTYPMRNEAVAEDGDGTVYVLSVSGTKMYDQAEHDYTAFGMTGVPTYQVLDIEIDGDRLVYRAHDIDGTVRDELIIDKSGR